MSKSIMEQFSELGYVPIICTLVVGYGVYHFFFKSKPEDDDFIKYLPPQKRKASIKPVANTRNFVQRAEKSNRQVIMFYGSQTGTSEEYSFRISQNARRYGLRTLVCNPEDADFEELENLKNSELENKIILVCTATYGEGDPPDNFQEFYEWINESEREADMLNGCYFAVFGCGNRTYEHFNKTAKVIDKRLEQLGAERIMDIGLGDDNGSVSRVHASVPR